MATTYCYYTQTTPTNNKKWTYSFWFKRGTLGVVQNLMSCWEDGNNHTIMRLNASDQLSVYDWANPTDYTLVTTRVFKDTGAWYHVTWVWDNANVTEGDRVILYINGVRETVFGTETYPTTGWAPVMNTSGNVVEIGRRSDGGYFDGDMSHIQFVDGTACAPTDFGEFDSTSGIWKIKTGAFATPGNNGFFLKMEDRTNLDLDSGTNAFTFTTSGDLTATYDNPSDNFCIWSRLNPQAYPWYMSNGNTTAQTAVDSTWRSVFSTLGNDTGKYYFECELDDDGGAGSVGILATEQQAPSNSQFSDLSLGYAA